MTKVKIWQNPIKWYVNAVKGSIEPSNLSHRIRMHIDIPKGQTKGRALIPCAIYSYDHGIDLNPALIRRKDGKKIKELPVNKNISYDSKKYDVQLTKEEKKKGFTLEEIERCKHCGQRTVIAEIAETRYRSCPDIKVRVADKAKEDLRIPVDFGINKTDVYVGMWSWLVVDVILAYVVLNSVFKWDPIAKGLGAITSAAPTFVSYGLMLPLVIIATGIATISIAQFHYKAYALWKWWREVKHTVTKIRVTS